MPKSNGSPRPSDFPSEESFVDFAGRTRTFSLEVMDTPIGHLVLAVENAEGDDGYAFDGFSSIDPFHALGLLRGRIRKGLSVRHLMGENGRLSLTHDRMRGRVSYGGVVVDGTFLAFDQLAEILQSYEGFQFDLKLVDSSGELE